MLACEGKKLKKGALNRPSVKEVGLLRTPFPTRDKPCSRRCLFEVLRTAFSALALRAFRNILQFSAFKQGFHDNLTAARAKKLMRRDRGTRVLTGSTHGYLLKTKLTIQYRNLKAVSSKMACFSANQEPSILTRTARFAIVCKQFYFGGSLCQ